MSLEEAIQQLITLGEKDPAEIARKIEERHGRDWLADELLARSTEFVGGMARQRLGAERRHAVVRIPKTDVPAGELKLKSVWIPDLLAPGVGGHKAMADCTAEDFDRRATWLTGLSEAVARQSQWFRDLADRMRDQGAKTFRGYRGQLPTLPDPELEAA